MIDIYYVEDDENIARIVKEYLEQRSCRVSVFHTIAAAQKAFEGHVPAAALVDWNMPDGRGDSLCRWIRSRWKELPLIFLTVRGDSRDIVSGFENGADDYVVKPFDWRFYIPASAHCSAGRGMCPSSTFPAIPSGWIRTA